MPTTTTTTTTPTPTTTRATETFPVTTKMMTDATTTKMPDQPTMITEKPVAIQCK